MVSIYDVDTTELIEELAKELKSINGIKPPEWAKFVKTGVHKERVPARDDWWHIRAASMLRFVKKTGPIGVSKLRRKYGGKKNRGVAKERFYKGSGSITRKILQQLEKTGLLKQDKVGLHKGRVITPKGASLIDKTAKKIFKPRIQPKKQVKASEPKQTAKTNKPAKEKKEAKEKAEPKPQPAKQPEPNKPKAESTETKPTETKDKPVPAKQPETPKEEPKPNIPKESQAPKDKNG